MTVPPRPPHPVPRGTPHPSWLARRARPLALAAGLLVSLSPALGQPESTPPQPPPPAPGAADLEPFQGRPVRRIVFRVPAPTPQGAPQGAPESLSPSDEALARNQLRQIEGAPFDPRVVSQDISRLNRLGRFRRVEARVQQLADGSVELAYDVTLQPLITAVQTIGNRVFDDDELVKDLALEGTPVDPTQLERACRRIEAQYRARGYYNALATIDQAELDESGIVVFRIREGERILVTSVRFEGVTAFTPRQLQSAIKTREAWLIDRLRERASVDTDVLDADVGALIAYYRDRGYLDVRADRVVTPSADGREALVTFVIDEGQQYNVRAVLLRSAPGETPVFEPEQIAALIPLKAGDVYSDSQRSRSLQAIGRAYHALGYADARVGAEILREPGRPLVDIRFVITQGPPLRVGLVEVRGNAATRSDVIREQITIRPGDALDPVEIDESRKRLERLRLFETNSVRTAIQPGAGEDPGARDVLFEVQETNTRSFNFGAGVSSDASITGTISLTQTNFDITDIPTSWNEVWSGEAFYGGGQTFKIEALPGDRVRAFSISLTDPSAFGSDYSTSSSVYFRDRLYSAYTEQRVGARFSIGRRFGSRWQVNFPFVIETVDLREIDSDAPTEYFELEEGSTLASVGVRLSRTSVDNVAFPSVGSNAEVGLYQYVGEEAFTRTAAEYSRFFKLEEDALNRKTVLQLTARAGYILQDQEDVPFYERLYLGGQSFRGFGFRGVAPVGIRNDNGEPSDETVGGVFSFFAGAEIRRPLLTDLVSGVLFIDTGTVDEDLSFDKYRVSVGFGIRIYVEQLSSAPLAFDFGFPILKQDTDDTRILTFTFDLPFD
ncbi:MAG: outer membrane protein assembly factor BamA [Planctomycetota bacterium]|nr:outer membrane protein assembly factor BamA [Planctomycetota bacterium]